MTINYNKNKLIDTCLETYYGTFARTLDTADFVPEKYNKKILAYIFKNMKRQFRRLDRADAQYQRSVRRKDRAKAKQANAEAKEKARSEKANAEAEEKARLEKANAKAKEKARLEKANAKVRKNARNGQ